MPRSLLVIAWVTALSACTTYKMWSPGDSSQEEGVARLTYEYRRFENPQVDERAGLSMARERCADWGYRDARRKGEDRECIDGTSADCSKWRVIREYRCLNGAKQ
jgi:hypothetical protein